MNHLIEAISIFCIGVIILLASSFFDSLLVGYFRQVVRNLGIFIFMICFIMSLVQAGMYFFNMK